MSGSKKIPGGLMQRDVQGGLDKLEEFHPTIVELDDAFNVVDIRAAYNSTLDSHRVGETIEAIRLRLRSLTQTFQYDEEPGYRVNAIQFSDAGKMEGVDQKQRISYSDLRRFLQYHEAGLPLTADFLKYWQDLQIEKLPGWFERKTTRREKIQPGNELDMHVELFENALRRIPAYGKEFEIDRDTITYNGNLQALLNALKRDRLEGIIVETYPQRLPRECLKNVPWGWLIKNSCWSTNWRGEINRIDDNDNTDHDVTGSIGGLSMEMVRGVAKIKFLFKVLEPKTEFSIDQQLVNRGGRHPNLTELLFVRIGHSNSNGTPGLKEKEVYQMDNDFKEGVFQKKLGVYFTCLTGDLRQQKDDARAPYFLYYLFDDSRLPYHEEQEYGPPQKSLYIL